MKRSVKSKATRGTKHDLFAELSEGMMDTIDWGADLSDFYDPTQSTFGVDVEPLAAVLVL